MLGPAGWKELEHASTVAYSTCKCGPAVKSLEDAIKRGLFVEIPSPPAIVLRRIIETGHVAKGMPPLAKRWLADVSRLGGES